MNTRIQGGTRQIVSAGLLTAAALLGFACTSPKVVVAPPPPPGPATAPKYDYNHTVTAPKTKDRKPVVAMLRTDDIAEFGDVLPFGRSRVVVIDAEGQPKRVELKGKEDAPVFLPPEVRQFVVAELVRRKEMVVVDRERIIEILREQAFSAGPHVTTQTAPKRGRLIGVHYILEAAFFPPGSRPAIQAAAARRAGAMSRRKIDPETQALVYINAYDVETGEVKAVGRGTDANDLVACRRAVEDLSRQFGDVNPPIRLVSFDDKGNAVLDVGATSGTKAGDRFAARTPQGKKVVLEAWKVDPLSCVARFITGTHRDVVPGTVARHEPDTPPSAPGS